MQHISLVMQSFGLRQKSAPWGAFTYPISYPKVRTPSSSAIQIRWMLPTQKVVNTFLELWNDDVLNDWFAITLRSVCFVEVSQTALVTE